MTALSEKSFVLFPLGSKRFALPAEIVGAARENHSGL